MLIVRVWSYADMSSLVNFTTILTTITPVQPAYVVIPPFIPSSPVDLPQPGAMPDRPLTVRRYDPFTDLEPRRSGDHPFRSLNSDTHHPLRWGWVVCWLFACNSFMTLEAVVCQKYFERFWFYGPTVAICLDKRTEVTSSPATTPPLCRQMFELCVTLSTLFVTILHEDFDGMSRKMFAFQSFALFWRVVSLQLLVF